MGDAALLLQIRVVIGSTRAAARSLGADDGQFKAVLERGSRLLDEMEPEVERDGSDAVREALAHARGEIAKLREG